MKIQPEFTLVWLYMYDNNHMTLYGTEQVVEKLIKPEIDRVLNNK